MIIVKENSPAKAWRKTLATLIDTKSPTDDRSKKLFKDSVFLLELNNSEKENYDVNFPMTEEEINIINEYLVYGKKENEVIHEWTKKYRSRLFIEDKQIDRIIEYLKKKPYGKKAQASLWKQEEDINAKVAPCLQILWFQANNQKLDLHIHMRACDCYGKLLMNINEFVALQNFVAEQLNMEIGNYYMFVDSLHFNLKDKSEIEKVNTLLQK